MDIKNLDLNLLRVFDAVYRHCSVSRAAEELGMGTEERRGGEGGCGPGCSRWCAGA